MTALALKKHRLSHSGIKPYKCSTCDKAFPMRYMVRDHERTHTGKKIFAMVNVHNLAQLQIGAV
jgi:uncharacterized Zn-finger protein